VEQKRKNNPIILYFSKASVHAGAFFILNLFQNLKFNPYKLAQNNICIFAT